MKQNPFDFNDYIHDMLEQDLIVNITSIQLTHADWFEQDYGMEGQEPERAHEAIGH